MLVLIRNGEVYGPEPQGNKDVLLCAGKIALLSDEGAIDPRGAEALGLEIDVIDARGCIVAPGFIDPHTHLTGGSGGCPSQGEHRPRSESLRHKGCTSKRLASRCTRRLPSSEPTTWKGVPE